MKKIICLGDSNTFGFNPKNGSRFDSNTRWTGVLSELLGSDYKVIEEGCNNRTGFCINPAGVLQSGQKYMQQCLIKHSEFDIFILALGTNDLQKLFSIDYNIVVSGLSNLVCSIRDSNKDARVIIVSPVILSEAVLEGNFSFQFDKTSIESSLWIQDIYKEFAKSAGCELLDLNQYVCPSTIDGLHFDSDSHKIIAMEIAKQILKQPIYESYAKTIKDIKC